MKEIEKELDRLVQRLSNGRRCCVCGGMATETHHIIGKQTPLQRYDLVNFAYVCRDCHRDIHDKGVKVPIFAVQKDYLESLRNKSYKDFLTFEVKMSETEYLKWCKNIFTNLLRK